MESREADRLVALHRYQLLDAPAEDELEAIVRVAAAVAGVPYATLNLIDEQRQCQLTTVGFDGQDSPRDESMCAAHFQRGLVVVSDDASSDPRFAANPWVDGRRAAVRFYASAPLVTDDGYALGTLCVFDTVPGRLDEDQICRLQDLAAVVLALFERRRQARRAAALAEELATRKTALELANQSLSDREHELHALVAELERSNTELEQFAAVAGHDLAAPLTAIAGYVHLVADVYHEQLDDRARAWIRTALDAVDRMRALITALLSYAETGSAACQTDVVAVQDVLDEVVSDLRSTIDDSGATVCADGELPVLSADPTLLRQLLQNLLGNAIKYRRPDRPSSVTVTVLPVPYGWQFRVADNGTGIPEEHRQRVFRVFERVEGTGRAGHGIGLATCQRIVDRHGGRIWAEHTPGGGTTVVFTLPARRTDMPGAAGLRPSVSSRSS
jgi:signal transduction histidine kinase